MNIKKMCIYVIACFYSMSAFACTTIIVGKNASVNGRMIVARNADSSDSDAVYLTYHKPSKYGFIHQNTRDDNSFKYQMPNNLQGYSGVPLSKTNFREESGFNDSGVGLSGTETIFSNKQTLDVDPYLKSGISEESLTSVILPQIKSAKAGVLLLGSIIEKYGSAEGFGVAFMADDGIWYLENAGGHLWVAVKIPDKKYFVSANQSRIGVVDLNDKQNVLSSPKILEFAKKNKLMTDNEKFNFRKIFGKDNNADINYNYSRVKYLQNIFTPSQQNKVYTENSFPTFLTPEKKLTITDVEKALQSHYQNTPQDAYIQQDSSVSPRPISVYRTRQSHVLTHQENYPVSIANIEYLSLGMSSLSIYVPFYQGANIPFVYSIASTQSDSYSAYWKFRKLQMMAMLNFPKYSPIVQKRFDLLNQDIQQRQVQFENKYLSLYKSNPEDAKILLDNFTITTTAGVLAVVEELTNELTFMQSASINSQYAFHGA